VRELFQLLTQRWRVNDAEYIERARRWVVWYDRWRLWYRFFAVAVVLFTIVVCVQGVQAIQDFNNIWPGARPGFFLGFIVGIKLGFLCIGAAHLLVVSFGLDARKEKLLLRYHDALNDLRQLTKLPESGSDTSAPARLDPPRSN
jgi:hypothetical protein